MQQLPIYRLAPANVSTASVIDTAARVFGVRDNYRLTENGHRIGLQSGSLTVEMETASGAVWAADQSQLFNPNLRPTLGSDKEALALAKSLCDERGLLPKLPDGIRWGHPLVAGTRLSTLTDGKQEDARLDLQVVFPVEVSGFPVVGGGGDFTVVFGDKMEPIGFHGGWRDVIEQFDANVIDPKAAEADFAKHCETGSLKLESVSSYVAYYAAPGSESQQFLAPVYVVGGYAVVGDQRVPLRTALFPATEFGPKVVWPEPQTPRPSKARPPVIKRKEKAKGSTKQGASGPQTLMAGAALTATKPWEAGASWIGMYGGLPGSKKNAQGFIDAWRADGWIIDFNWGDAAAFESDWRRNDDVWVDNADFVFYTGHANMNGWVLASPDDGSLQFTEVGNAPDAPGDLWGQNDLEWVVIAACGPLQDNVISPGGGSVLARWDGAFDGLHQLLGYGSVTNDNEVEGKLLAQYCREGQTVISAWFRTAKEVQPSTNGYSAPDGPTVWVGAMWASKAGADPANDHAWSHGSVSADPVSPTTLSCMWTVC